MFANAESYERLMGRWSRQLASQFAEFANLPEAGRVLDAGSGTGSMALAIAVRHRQASVAGIDPSPEYVTFANTRNPFPDRVHFEVGDAQELRFSEGSFDAAVSLLAFNFIPDPAKAVNALRRVVRPGGSISAAVWDYGGEMRMLRTFWESATAIDPTVGKQNEKRMALCRSGELGNLWRAGGLEDVQERAIDFQMRFESFADYWEPFLLGQGPAGAFVSGLAQDRREKLRAEIKKRLGAEDGAFELPARAWAVRGVVPGLS